MLSTEQLKSISDAEVTDDFLIATTRLYANSLSDSWQTFLSLPFVFFERLYAHCLSPTEDRRKKVSPLHRVIVS